MICVKLRVGGEGLAAGGSAQRPLGAAAGACHVEGVGAAEVSSAIVPAGGAATGGFRSVLRDVLVGLEMEESLSEDRVSDRRVEPATIQSSCY